MGLSIKQQVFVNAYLRTFNATKAAKEAGYSEHTAYSQGARLLKNAEIAAYVHARLEADAMDSREVLYHLAQIARGDISDLVDDRGNLDLPKAVINGKSNLIKRVKNRTVTTADKDGEGTDIFETETEGYDRLRALELIGKYLKLWTDKVQVDDWRTQAINDIKAGRIDFKALVEAFDSDLATTLFTEAGVPISTR